MSYIFLDYNKPHNHIGDIQVYAINDNTLTLVILGLHNNGCECGNPGHMGDCGPYFHLLISLKYELGSDLYTIIHVSLKAITNHFIDKIRHHGYTQSIVDKNDFAGLDIDESQNTKYYKYTSLYFIKENMKYLTFHDPMIPAEYEPYVVYGEISEEGIFKYKGEIIEFKELLETRKKGDVFLHTY